MYFPSAYSEIRTLARFSLQVIVAIFARGQVSAGASQPQARMPLGIHHIYRENCSANLTPLLSCCAIASG
jgi:hypothetical protein